WATSGGEDFELLLACDPNSVAPLCDGLRRATGTVLTVVGEIEAGETVVTFLDRAGHPVRVEAGYEHFRA
ncbi:MAG TPA: thiamine-phosphate kinase, partial [Methylomirabilota bacterium]|nr:thiamine-phosphate kinase [Methylomirabilota bacterium]